MSAALPVTHTTVEYSRTFSHSVKSEKHFMRMKERCQQIYEKSHPEFLGKLLENMGSSARSWKLKEEHLHQSTLHLPSKAFLVAKAKYMSEKYGICLKVVSLEDLDDSLCSLTDEDLSFPCIGLVVLIQKDHHAVPMLLKMKATKDNNIFCTDCLVMDADDNSCDTLFGIFEVLESFGMGEDKILRASPYSRQVDNESCKTGAMSLVRNALLDAATTPETSIFTRYPITEGKDPCTGDDVLFFELPCAWTWGEQIFHYPEDVLRATPNPRDLFSSKFEKRVHPRSIFEMRSKYTQAVDVVSVLSSTEDKTEVFAGCALPDDISPAAVEIRATSHRTYNVYLQAKGLKDSTAAGKYTYIAVQRKHKKKRVE